MRPAAVFGAAVCGFCVWGGEAEGGDRGNNGHVARRRVALPVHTPLHGPLSTAAACGGADPMHTAHPLQQTDASRILAPPHCSPAHLALIVDTGFSPERC